ncbi:hypothetical protein C8J57DRAFT_1526644 [Mycena rebaudengoi]|nr:hypothetical protein C8J57DRAFT_1526644 [Mycena rebaudengoi]
MSMALDSLRAPPTSYALSETRAVPNLDLAKKGSRALYPTHGLVAVILGIAELGKEKEHHPPPAVYPPSPVSRSPLSTANTTCTRLHDRCLGVLRLSLRLRRWVWAAHADFGVHPPYPPAGLVYLSHALQHRIAIISRRPTALPVLLSSALHANFGGNAPSSPPAQPHALFPSPPPSFPSRPCSPFTDTRSLEYIAAPSPALAVFAGDTSQGRVAVSCVYHDVNPPTHTLSWFLSSVFPSLFLASIYNVDL